MTQKTINYFRRLGHDVLGLVYPNLCCGCGASLYRGEKVICTSCVAKMPRTNYHRYHDNPIDKIFWGRVKLENATSFFLFIKGSPYQNMLHHLKYRGRRDVGICLGEMFGRDLLEAPGFSQINCIIPVPLHPDKERKRGYNQSQVIAEGLANVLGIAVETNVLKRQVFTQTQTKKSRYERWENVEEVFDVQNPGLIEGKHVLLVDDVLTTGATLEGCAHKLLKINGVKISVATLAFATL